ncbi:MAG: molybdopterin converting factor subunit 1 [Pseudohongiellaceae bacterium]
MLEIHYFASVRESLDCDTENLSLPDTVTTVEQLIQHLVDIHGPLWQKVLQDDAVLVALDQTMARKNSPLAGVKEVAFFPPVTGG